MINIKKFNYIFYILIFTIFIFFTLFNTSLITSPNDGIFYFSIAKNIIENFSMYDGTNLSTNLLTSQPGISVIIAFFLLVFDQYWAVPFSVCLAIIWLVAIKKLSYALSITIFKDLAHINNIYLIQFLIMGILFSSVFLVRISTSFYNESIYIPLQMYLTAKFLLIAYDYEYMDRKNEIFLLISFIGIFFRTQHIIFLLIFLSCLFLIKKIRLSFLIMNSILLFGYFLWIASIQDSIFFELGNLKTDIFKDLSEKIFLSINSAALILNLYFISLKNYFYSIIIIAPLLFIYATGAIKLYKKSKVVFSFICLIIVCNIAFIFFALPLNYFDDYARFYWFQFIPQIIIFLFGLDTIFYKFKIIFNPTFLLLIVLLSPSMLLFNSELKGKLKQLIFFKNNLSIISELNAKWNLTDAIVYSDSLRREFYWVTKKGTYSTVDLYKNTNKCAQKLNNYLITSNGKWNLEIIDSQNNIKLYKVCTS